MNPEHPASSLDEAFDALRRLPVPAPPPDAPLLARLPAGVLPAADPVSPSRRRMLMRLMTWSLAASVLIAVGATVLFLGSPTVALADVVKAAKKYKVVRVQLTQVTDTTDAFTPTGELTSTVYWDLESPRSRSESTVGDNELLDIQDHVKGRQLMTHSRNRTGTLFLRKANKSLSFLDNLNKLRTRKETTSSKEQLDRQETVKYVLRDGANTTTLWVDSKSKLPIRMEYVMDNPTATITRNKWTWTEFEWDAEHKDIKKLDDLFRTSPPKDFDIKEVDSTGEEP